jgi:uncharacterized protein YbcI
VARTENGAEGGAKRSLGVQVGAQRATGTETRAVRPDSGLLAGGELLSAISTRFVKMLREHYGRGPIKAKTYALDDIIVVVLRGTGFTPLEKTMMAGGAANSVVAIREQFQGLMARRYTDAIEELTDRKVQAFLSQAHVDPDITLEVFFIDRPLAGFGAFEVVDGGKLPRV